ncbi:MAG: NAD(P)-binding protein [Acidimicrobiia bacterium]|nr:NAD(P)-binding protein [Acidimicrobiia bacterium]
MIGAGPAGLTAAYQLLKADVTDLVVVEADDVVGGISRTVERDGWRFDIGGHRFFTKVPEVEKLWFELLAEELMVRPRMSRIFYDGKFFDYPLRAANALGNLGVVEAARCVVSYAAARVRPPKDQSNFETWVASRFGWRLYRTFFKTYTEKLWGVDATEIQADWAAQRIKNLSLGKAVVNSLLPKRGSTDVTSLIEEFLYPKLGPGMMWETCRDRVVEGGADVQMRTPVSRIERGDGRAVAVWTEEPEGAHRRHECDEVVSSMPLGDLVLAMDPPAPADVRAAAAALKHRDFLTVALVVPEDLAFPDNWIYVHSPEVKLGRVQNFGAWSPHMVKPGRTCLGLEYFVNRGDEYWSMSDEELIALGKAEAAEIGIVPSADVVESGYVVRMPAAYPVYDGAYAANVEVLRAWLEANTPNVQPVGRNGMHRYNNQDHSMLTAMLAVENILKGAGHDLWAVNVEEEYHEEIGAEDRDAGRQSAGRGTGRAAPIIG